ncbi:MAG: hypothetical protein AAF480_11755 [Actinomycetota bacterium]
MPGIGERIERFESWRRDLTSELIRLPDTLRQLREGAANFEIVGQRLAESSEALEEITKVYRSTMGETTRRSAEVAEQLKEQLESLAGESPDMVATALGEMQKGFESLAELNPFWPKRPKTEG